MKFTPDPEQRDFAASLRDFLASSDLPSVTRAWAKADIAPGRKLWTRLIEMGMPELAADPVGLVLAFEELGRSAAPGPYVESLAVLPALGIDPGEAMATLAMPPHVPFALDAAVADAVYLVQGSTLSTASVTGTRPSVDGARLLSTVAPVDDIGAVDPNIALNLGALATAAQILGAGTAVFERSTAYAKQRVQFGTVIGSFQAIKHQLADAAVGLDLARPLLFGAAIALDKSSAGRDVSAAKVACTDAAYRAARVALQVHGAIGYTAEYDLALWLTKVRALVSAWGTQRVHRDRVLAAIRR
jgi:alkylation response protein AidB-like acyl-CoA dehydrogenase